MSVKITGFGIGNLQVNLEATEGTTLREVLAAAGISTDGKQFYVNGRRLAEAEAPSTVVREGDEVEVQHKPKAG